MKCELCKKPIEKYNPTLNNLKIDENCNVDLCQDCIDKFMKWQQGIYARLFPTKTMKKRFGSKEKIE
jgi:hypothetical protein